MAFLKKVISFCSVHSLLSSHSLIFIFIPFILLIWAADYSHQFLLFLTFDPISFRHFQFAKCFFPFLKARSGNKRDRKQNSYITDGFDPLTISVRHRCASLSLSLTLTLCVRVRVFTFFSSVPFTSHEKKGNSNVHNFPVSLCVFVCVC